METTTIILISVILFLILSIVILVILYFVFSVPLEKVCQSNTDCDGNICLDGVCIPATIICASENDCEEGQLCVTGRCVYPDGTCDSSLNCLNGSRCIVGQDTCVPIFENGAYIQFKSMDGSYIHIECTNKMYSGGSKGSGTRFLVEHDIKADGMIAYRFKNSQGMYLTSTYDGLAINDLYFANSFEVIYNDQDNSFMMTPYGSINFIYQAGERLPGDCSGSPLLVWNNLTVPDNAEAVFYTDIDQDGESWIVAYKDIGERTANSISGISSLTLRNIDVEVFSGTNGTGESALFRTDVDNLTRVRMTNGTSWNDRISSVRLIPRGVNNRSNPYKFQLRFENTTSF